MCRYNLNCRKRPVLTDDGFPVRFFFFWTTVGRNRDNPERQTFGCPPLALSHSTNRFVCALPPTQGNQSNVTALGVRSGTIPCCNFGILLYKCPCSGWSLLISQFTMKSLTSLMRLIYCCRPKILLHTLIVFHSSINKVRMPVKLAVSTFGHCKHEDDFIVVLLFPRSLS